MLLHHSIGGCRVRLCCKYLVVVAILYQQISFVNGTLENLLQHPVRIHVT